MLKFKLLLISLILISLGLFLFVETWQAIWLIYFLLGVPLAFAIIVPKVHRVKRDRRIVARTRQELEVTIQASQTMSQQAREHRPLLFVPPELQ